MSCLDKCAQASKNNAIIAENMVKIYEEGLKDGCKEEQEKDIDITENGTTEVTPDEGKALSKVTVNVAVGGDGFYDVFWDTYQKNGTRTDYELAFAKGYFDSKNFKPKYDLRATDNIQNMFGGFPDAVDLREILNACGVVLDFSNAIKGGYVFNGSKFTALPTIASKQGLMGWFWGCVNLHTIEKLVIKREWDANKLNAFSNNPKLQNITIEGEIGANFSTATSPALSDASVQSIIDHLVDLTGSTSQKVSFHSTVTAKLTEEQYNTITAKNWTIG